jgi:manganese/iron transport system permease protein
VIRLLVDPFQAPYLQRALIEAVLLGVLAGIVGVHVVLRRLTFMADTYTHTVFPGLAVAFAAGSSLFLGALGAGVLSALAFTLLDRSRRVTSEAALAVVLTSFFAVGVIVVSRTERYTADLTGLLFGRILTVDAGTIAQTAGVLALVAGALALTHKELVLRAFDVEAARALGYPVGRLDLLVNVLVVLVVVASARAVGTALTVALLITPAATARLVCRSVEGMYVVAAAVGALGAWLGLAASYEASIHHGLRLASGATIVLATTTLFLATLAGRALATRLGHRGDDMERDPIETEPSTAEPMAGGPIAGGTAGVGA